MINITHTNTEQSKFPKAVNTLVGSIVISMTTAILQFNLGTPFFSVKITRTGETSFRFLNFFQLRRKILQGLSCVWWK